MTYEEAIKHTKAFLKIYELFNDDRIAIEKGIEALENCPPEDSLCYGCHDNCEKCDLMAMAMI